MTRALYPDDARPVKPPARSLIEDLATLADKHLRRREEVMEEVLRELSALLRPHEAMMTQSRAILQRARDLVRAALIIANTCWHCGRLGTPDDPVVDRSYEGHMLDERGYMAPSGQLIPDQACRDHRRCIERQAEREASDA